MSSRRSTLLLSWNNERAAMLVSSLMRVAPCSFVKKSFASGHRSRHHHLCKFVATKESGYRVRVKLPEDLFKTPKWPPFTTWRTWRHVEKLYTLGKSYPFLKKPGQVTYVSLETNAYNATSKWLTRKGFKVKRPFAFNPLVYGLIWCIVFFVNRLHFSRFKMKKAELAKETVLSLMADIYYAEHAQSIRLTLTPNAGYAACLTLTNKYRAIVLFPFLAENFSCKQIYKNKHLLAMPFIFHHFHLHFLYLT